MARFQSSNFVQGAYYHIYNRGNRKDDIFLEEKDYKRYLERLKQYKEKHNISIIAYCLMPNHIHLLVRQNGPQPVSTFIQRLHTSYSMYFNKKHNAVGHVFQDRFKAKLVDKDEYLIHLSRYIHLNPKNTTKKLIAYKWSSFPTYLGHINDECSEPLQILKYFKNKKESLEDASIAYRYFVQTAEEEFYKMEHLLLDYKD